MLNAIITSLLFKKHPNELKLVLIDPKKVEFSFYSPIAKHFMAALEENTEDPILTDIKKVIHTLNSLCSLIESRYDMLKRAGTRNIVEYNKKYVNHLLSPSEGYEYMPYIVVIIDDFDSLMMSGGKEMELPIVQLTHLAHIVGVHLIIATQHPTHSIITEDIKNNIPSRIIFRTNTANDSKHIIDCPDGNQLIGNGDMLYFNGGNSIRVQCAYVNTGEIERINEYIARQQGPMWTMELPDPLTDENMEFGHDRYNLHNLDPLLEEAAMALISAGIGSTSVIQRKLSIGYNRAGRMMDQLERLGIVGPAQGSKPRKILITDKQVVHILTTD